MAFHILVLDAHQRSALAVTRALGSLPDVTVTTADSAVDTLACSSKLSIGNLLSPSSELEPGKYLDWLAQYLEVQRVDLVVPVTEITSQLLLMNQHRFAHLPLPFADYLTVMSLADKGKLVALAEQNNVPCPASQWFASSAELDVDMQSFPIVLKPCLSKIYTGAAWVATRVRVLYSKEELMEELQQSQYLHKTPFMLQEFIPGHGAGIFCLYDHGKPHVFFAHRRLREKPPQGGVSVLSESVMVDPVLRDYADKLLSAVQWHGVAMVEFRINPESGLAYLMEVNTRFWGSLQLAIDAGVNFPRLLWLAELARNGQGEPALPIDSYRIGQRLRWLLGDLDSLYLYLKGSYSWAQKLQRICQFLTPSLGYTRHEINRWGDLGPARHELSLYIKHLTRR